MRTRIDLFFVLGSAVYLIGIFLSPPVKNMALSEIVGILMMVAGACAVCTSFVVTKVQEQWKED